MGGSVPVESAEWAPAQISHRSACEMSPSTEETSDRNDVALKEERDCKINTARRFMGARYRADRAAGTVLTVRARARATRNLPTIMQRLSLGTRIYGYDLEETHYRDIRSRDSLMRARGGNPARPGLSPPRLRTFNRTLTHPPLQPPPPPHTHPDASN